MAKQGRSTIQNELPKSDIIPLHWKNDCKENLSLVKMEAKKGEIAKSRLLVERREWRKAPLFVSKQLFIYF